MNCNHKVVKHNKRGAALISALMCLVILGIICSGFVQVIFKDNKFTQNSIIDIVALYTAESGLEYGKWLIKHNLTYYPARDISVRNSASNNYYLASPPNKLLAGSIYNLWGASAISNTGSTIFPSSVTNNSVANDVRGKLYEFVYMSDLSFEDDRVSGRINSLGRINCLSSFIINARPNGFGRWGDYTSYLKGNYSGVDVNATSDMHANNGVPVMLISIGRIWSYPNNGTFRNGINSYGDFLQYVASSTLYDQGFELKASRSIRCFFSHGCALREQSGRVDIPNDPAMTEYFTNYGECYR